MAYRKLASSLLLHACVCTLGIGWVYYPMFTTGLARVSGDLWDARIMLAMLEHWRNVLLLGEHPLNVLWFFPTRTAIAYNDALLVGGLAYAGFRQLGLDWFISYELMNIAVRLAGYAATYLFARRILQMRLSFAVFAAFLMLIITNLAYRMGHAQLLYANLVPLGLYVFWALYRGLHAHVAQFPRDASFRLHVGMISFGAFIYLWAMTAFYSLYVFCLLLAVLLVVLHIIDRRTRAATALILRSGAAYLASGFVAIAFAIIGVFAVYRTANVPGHRVEALAATSGDYVDLLNVGRGNVLWSDVLAPLYLKSTGRELTSSELTTGFTPTLLVIAAAAFIWIVGRRRRGDSAQIFAPLDVAVALGTASVAIGFFAFKTAGHPNWAIPFQFLPGAQVIRVPMRLLLFITPGVILLATFGLDMAFRHAAGLKVRAGIAALGLVIAVEQLRVDLPFAIDRVAENVFLRGLPRPPATCRSFYIARPRFQPSGNATLDTFYVHSVDAMLLAEVLRLPTVNGMATFQPKGWDLHAPFAPDYISRVQAYAERNGIAGGLCGLDLESNLWTVGPS